MGDWLFLVDIAIALSIPTLFAVLHLSGRAPRSFWTLYWFGFAIGLTWELAFHFTGPEYSADPTYINFAHFPLPPIVQPFMHALWDGGLFMVGVVLVRKLCRPPHLACYRLAELGVMLAWGQTQEWGVELLATSAGLWTFTPRWWNPVLFEFGQGVITLAPQLIWFVAPLVFYAGAVPINRRIGSA